MLVEMRSGALIRVMVGVFLIFVLAQGVQAAAMYSWVDTWYGPGNPWGMAVDGNHGWVYVADHINGKVWKYDTNGEILWQKDIPNWGIAVDKDGNIYTDSDRIRKYSSDGKHHRCTPDIQRRGPVRFSVAEDIRPMRQKPRAIHI